MKLLLSHWVLFGLLGITSSKQIINLNLTNVDAVAYGCGDACRNALSAATPADFQKAGKDFDIEFYATASNFSTELQPGEVLKFEAVDANKLNVDSGTTVYRMQYTSLDLDGSIVPATGFVAFPQIGHDGSSSQFRVVAYAHGTIGLFQGCAPSNGPSLYNYYTWLALLQRGYAVVATDYAGLGNNYTTHKYLSLSAHASDVYYSVNAARKIFGSLFTKEWMSAGHSQGGGAAWKLAESRYVQNDTNYLGTVAIAPATYIVDMFLDNLQGSQFAGYLTFIPFSIKRAVPSFNAEFLGAAMKKRIELAEKLQVCIKGMFSMTVGLQRNELLDEDGIKEARPILQKWQNMSSPALGDKSAAPVLVIQGSNDTTVQPSTTEEAWKKSCDFGNRVHLRLYQGQEHAPAVQASAPEWLGWIDQRFAVQRGQLPVSSSCEERCSKLTRKLMDGKLTKASLQT